LDRQGGLICGSSGRNVDWGLLDPTLNQQIFVEVSNIVEFHFFGLGLKPRQLGASKKAISEGDRVRSKALCAHFTKADNASRD
jgi:hypothetical protein